MVDMNKKKLFLSFFIIPSLFLALIFLNISCARQSQKTKNTGITNAKGLPSYVFYYAKWCGYCKKMTPDIMQAKIALADKVYFYFVNVDSVAGQEFSSKYRKNQAGIPHSQLYDAQGNFLKEQIGLMSYKKILNFVQ
jgi:thiol-disulfide isomerase/thioredoxin